MGSIAEIHPLIPQYPTLSPKSSEGGVVIDVVGWQVPCQVKALPALGKGQNLHRLLLVLQLLLPQTEMLQKEPIQCTLAVCSDALSRVREACLTSVLCTNKKRHLSD